MEYVKLGTKIKELLGKIKEEKSFVVLDENGNYYGILPRDVLVKAGFNLEEKIDKLVIRIKPIKEWNINEIVKKMISSNVRVVPVEENGKLKLITIYDVLEKIKDSEVFNEEVEKYMHEEVITIYEKDPVSKAIILMKRKGVSRLVVVNKEGKPIGIITAGDIVRNVLFEKEKPKYGELSEKDFKVEVRSIMSSPLLYVNKSDKLKKALNIILKKRIFALPVIDSELEGIISAKELLIAYLKYLEKEKVNVIIHGIRIDEIDYEWIRDRFKRLVNKYYEIIGEEPTLILHIKKIKEYVEDNVKYFYIRAKLIGGKIKLYASYEGIDLYSSITKVLYEFREQLERKKYEKEKEYLLERYLKEGL